MENVTGILILGFYAVGAILAMILFKLTDIERRIIKHWEDKNEHTD